jgi:hypothetical protein
MRGQFLQCDGAERGIGKREVFRQQFVDRRQQADFALIRGLRKQQAGEDLGRRADFERTRQVRLCLAPEEPGLAIAAVEPAGRDLLVGACVDTVLQVLSKVGQYDGLRMSELRRGGEPDCQNELVQKAAFALAWLARE